MGACGAFPRAGTPKRLEKRTDRQTDRQSGWPKSGGPDLNKALATREGINSTLSNKLGQNIEGVLGAQARVKTSGLCSNSGNHRGFFVGGDKSLRRPCGALPPAALRGPLARGAPNCLRRPCGALPPAALRGLPPAALRGPLARGAPKRLRRGRRSSKPKNWSTFQPNYVQKSQKS